MDQEIIDLANMPTQDHYVDGNVALIPKAELERLLKIKMAVRSE